MPPKTEKLRQMSIDALLDVDEYTRPTEAAVTSALEEVGKLR